MASPSYGLPVIDSFRTVWICYPAIYYPYGLSATRKDLQLLHHLLTNSTSQIGEQKALFSFQFYFVLKQIFHASSLDSRLDYNLPVKLQNRKHPATNSNPVGVRLTLLASRYPHIYVSKQDISLNLA